MKRIESLLSLLEKLGAEAAILNSPENIFYFSGFRGEGVVIISKTRLVILTDSRYTLMAKNDAPLFEILPRDTALSICVGDASDIAYEDYFLSVSAYQKLKDTNTGKNFVPFGQDLIKLRQHKDAEELSAIQNAVKLADEAYLFTLSRICPGMHEYEVAALLEGYMRKEAGALPSFETICASGERSAMPHGVASDRVLQKGDFLTMDFGCNLCGYCSDITRTISIGPATSRQKELYNIVLYAQTLAENAAKCGMSAATLDAIARDSIQNFGYGAYFGHALGHGVGIEIHEFPTISSNSSHIISEGDVFTIEPGIYIPDECGVRIEDMLYTTESGCEILTKSPKNLVEIL